ncbi:hypothetical protein COHA_004560 [Chlorella ohadii]|uniref:peptidyl-tRNA hydrolase n=1 Tax=Chlorella ohadii TaxID=2649997 RepID=A0AAD5DSK5_9CHLO|nr:hypothetical protein COHA_004560 [Chlorella ohadii]
MAPSEWIVRGVSLAVGVLLGIFVHSRAQPSDDDLEYDSDDSGEGQPARARRRGPRALGSQPREELKMVLVVNDELKMGKGKIGAQCAHAAVGAVERLHELRQTAALAYWERCGQPKVCLRASSTQELRQLAAAAAGQGLPTFVVQDAGRTQVAPGSRTVLAIGPAPKSAIDKVTGHLRLL